jgi:hypothetical protein
LVKNIAIALTAPIENITKKDGKIKNMENTIPLGNNK